MWCTSVVFSSTLNLPVSGRIPPWCSASDDPVNCTDDTADEIMERIVRSATQGPSQRSQPRERRRSRANRKSCESYQLLIAACYPAISCMCRRCNDTLLSVCVHSEEDTEERFDDRGGERSGIVQRFRDAGVSRTRGRQEALSLPLRCLTWQPAPPCLGPKNLPQLR